MQKAISVLCRTKFGTDTPTVNCKLPHTLNTLLRQPVLLNVTNHNSKISLITAKIQKTQNLKKRYDTSTTSTNNSTSYVDNNITF